MVRLYANENFPFPVVEELRRLGHDVLTIQETGKAGIAMLDESVLAFARENDRALVTINRRHFIRLHSLSAQHSGIVVCSFDPDFTGLARRIHAAVDAQGSLSGQLIRVNRPA